MRGSSSANSVSNAVFWLSESSSATELVPTRLIPFQSCRNRPEFFPLFNQELLRGSILIVDRQCHRPCPGSMPLVLIVAVRSLPNVVLDRVEGLLQQLPGFGVASVLNGSHIQVRHND